VVLARRLSNAEYHYTIRDLTGGVDMRPTKEFPVDPANPAGFDNSGESLSMSPALLNKYLQAAREAPITWSSSPTGSHSRRIWRWPRRIATSTASPKIIDFYRRRNPDYSDYFRAAWRFKHHVALDKARATLASLAAESRVSPKYLATVWRTLEKSKEDIGPLAPVRERTLRRD
jgi:hypothetical protein